MKKPINREMQADIKAIFNHLKMGQYKNAIENLRSNCENLPITEEVSCNWFAASTVGLQSLNVSSDHLLLVLNELKFKDLQGDLLTSYIQSLYFVLKFFSDSNNLESIFKIQHLLLPPFTRNITTDKQIAYYKSTSNLLLVRINNEVKNRQTSTDLMCDLILLVTKMGGKFHEDLLARVECYFSILCSWRCHPRKIQDLYLCVLEMLRCDKIFFTKSFVTYKYILKMLNNVYKELSPEDDALVLFQKLYWTTAPVLRKVSDAPEDIHEFLSQVPAVVITLDKYTENTGAILEKLYVDLKTIREQNESVKYLQEICVVIIKSLQVASDQSKPAQLPKDVIFNYCQLAFNLGVAATGDPLTYSLKTINAQSVMSAYTLIGSIIKYAAKNSPDFISSKELHEILYAGYQNAVQIIVKMKLAQSDQLNTYWNSIGVDLYNTSIRLFRSKSEACLEFLELFIKTVLYIEGVNNSVITPNVTLKALEMYCQMHIIKKQFESALVVCALNIFLHYKQETVAVAYNQWIRCKTDGDKNYRSLTVVGALKNNFKQVKSLYPGFEEITQSDKITELLLNEFQVYTSKWCSNISMVGVLKELYLHADVEIMVTTFISIPLKDIINVGKDTQHIFEDCLRKLKNFKKASQGEIHVIKGYLNYFRYKFKTAELMTKNLDDMNNTMNIEKPEPLPHEEVLNKNDECDLVSAYESLQLHHHIEIFSILKQAFQHLKEAVRGSNVKENRFIVGTNFTDLINQMAHDFMLHCYDKEALDVLRLGLKIVRALNDEKSTMLLISLIIEHLRESSDLFKKLSLEADVLIKGNEFDASTLLVYYTALSFSYLRSNNIQGCLETNVLAIECFHKIESTSKDDALKIKYHYLQANLVNLPCSYKVERHEDLALIEILNAFKLSLVYILSGNNLSTALLLLVFNVTEHILNINSWMRLPREMRCYGRDAVCLAQKLVVPLRTSRLLLYLAKADWFSCRYDDCECKLDGVSYILALKRKRTQKEVKCEVNLDDAVIDLEEGIHEMLLECPTRNSSMGSPVLYKHRFKLPLFVTHPKSCDCFQCCNLEYQQLVMQKTHLEALLGESSGNIGGCQDYYQGIFKMFTCCDFQNKHKAFKSYNWNSLGNAYDNAMLDYIKFNLRNGEIEEARSLQTEFLTKVENDPCKNYYLYNEVLNMELNFLGDFINAVEPEVVASVVQQITLNESRTPESKVSKVEFNKKISPTIELFHPKPRKVPFDLDGLTSPVHFKTPAAKPKVYTGKSTRSNRTKKENTPTKSVRKRLDSDTNTQASGIFKDNTKARMEKLKENIKLTIPKIVITNEEKESRPMRAVRKNLMGEMGEAETAGATISENKVKRRNAMRVKPNSTASEISSTTGAVRKTRSRVLK